MARYPTFEEYQKRGNFEDGITHCDNLLKKNPNDVQLLTTKLQLVYADRGDGDPILDQLLSIQPPILDLRELVDIEEAVVESQHDDFPQPQTAGPAVTKLWENAFKASGMINQKLDLQSLRFTRAIMHDRIADAQQALIQLKALQPKNRVIYMAHAAVTQLLSFSKEDLQSRLALSLARKAVTEKFDDDKSLDCRVPGQIFALQGSSKDLDGIGDRSFKESKQVCNARRKINAPVVNGASPSQELKHPASIPPTEWLHSEVEILKQQFAALIQSNAQLEAVLSFVANAIRLFHTAATSLPNIRGRGRADACFLSISALVRAFEQSNEIRHLLQAACLAETLLKYDACVHEARLILVYLYMRLGLGSLAMRMFDSLSVKEVQHDTVGHALFTRISLTHPYSTALTRKEAFDPSKRAYHALTFYTRCEERLAENEASVLDHRQTGMIFDLHELRDNLRSSLSRRIIHLEERRLERLVSNTDGEDTRQMGPRLTADWCEVRDNRDFASTFDYGYNVEKVLYGYDDTLPGERWILYTLATDLAWCLAMGFPPPVNDSTDNTIEELWKGSLDMQRLHIAEDEPASLGMSSAEYLAGDLACQVLKLMRQLSMDSGELSHNFDAIAKAIDRLNIDALLDTSNICSERIADRFVHLDILRIVIRVCSFLSKFAKDCVDDLQKIQNLVKGYCSAIQSHAKDQMKRIKAAGILALMKKDARIWEAIKAFGDNNASSFCESVAVSAKEGWEGLTKIKLV